MSGILDERANPRRRYRLAGDAAAEAASEAHVDDLLAGYALGALDRAERAAVDAHARGCGRCAELLDEERRVVALLPLAAPPVKPAPDVKVALFARIAHAQRAAEQLDSPPSAARVLPPTMTIPASRPLGSATDAPAVAPPTAWRAERPERRSWVGRTGSFATLPLLVALVATGAWGLQMRSQVAESVGEVTSLQATLANFGADTSMPLYGSSGTTRPEGQLLIGANERQAMVKMTLDPDPTRDYGLFAMDTAGSFVPVADLRIDDQGNSQVFSLDRPLDSYEEVQVRAEALSGTSSEAVPLLFGDLNGAIGAGDDTSNNAAP